MEGNGKASGRECEEKKCEKRNVRKEWGIFSAKTRVEGETKERTYCERKNLFIQK